MPLNFSIQNPRDGVINKGHAIDISFNHQFNDKIQLTYVNRYIYNSTNLHLHFPDYYHDPIYTNDTLKRNYSEWNTYGYSYQVSLYTSFKFNTWKLKHQLLVGVDFSYGEHNSNHFGLEAPAFNINLPAYTYFDGGMGFVRRKITIHVNFYNLFNTKYITSGNATGLVYPGTPRSFRVSLNYTF
jgi:outer membrane receptor protein involved in Fe transport